MPLAIASGRELGGSVAERALQRVSGHPTIPPHGRPTPDRENVRLGGNIDGDPSSVEGVEHEVKGSPILNHIGW